MSPEMRQAIDAIAPQLPSGCSLFPEPRHPIYTLLHVDGWPKAVHYEFRSTLDSAGLCVELHTEGVEFSYLAETLQAVAEVNPYICGFSLNYAKKREGKNWKRWPSLRIELPAPANGKNAAAVMLRLIEVSRQHVQSALRD